MMMLHKRPLLPLFLAKGLTVFMTSDTVSRLGC